MKFRRFCTVFLLLALLLTQLWPVTAYAVEDIQLDAKAALLVDGATGTVLLDQDAHTKQYPASITKVMTALLVFEAIDRGELRLSDSITASANSVAGLPDDARTADSVAGETLTVEQLLYCMMLVSANEAACILAETVSGSQDAFVALMNQRAQELGCTGTNFTCAHGLFDYGNVSTAQDLAKIAAACAENQTFAQVAGTASYVMPATNLRKAEYTISSSNSLMNSESANYREYVQWVKGGFTTLAGRCIVAFAEKDGHTYGLVILGSNSQNIFREAAELFDWAFTSPELHPAPAETAPAAEKYTLFSFWQKLLG